MTESTHRRDRTHRVRSAVVVIALCVAAVACGQASATSTDALDAAITTMGSAPSYSFVATVAVGTDQVTVQGDYQAPNRIAETISRAGSAPVSVVLDGGTVHVADPATGTWSTKPATDTAAVDLRTTFAALSAHSAVRAHEDGWSFSVKGNAARVLAGADSTGDVAVTASTGTNGLTSLRYGFTTGGRQVTVTITYTNIGNAPRVVVPS